MGAPCLENQSRFPYESLYNCEAPSVDMQQNKLFTFSGFRGNVPLLDIPYSDSKYFVSAPYLDNILFILRKYIKYKTVEKK